MPKGKSAVHSCPNEPPCQECISSGRGPGCLKDTACGTDGKGRFLAGKCNNDKPCGRCISHDAGHNVGVTAGVQQDGYCYNTQYYKNPCMRGNPQKSAWAREQMGKVLCADSNPLVKCCPYDITGDTTCDGLGKVNCISMILARFQPLPYQVLSCAVGENLGI